MNKYQTIVNLLIATWLSVIVSQIQFPVITEAHEEVAVINEEIPAVEPITLTQEQQIIAYIEEKFGEDSPRAIKLLKECENKTFNTEAENWNSNGTWDFGLFQVNQVHGFTREQLKDPYFNTDVAHRIYKKAGHSFTPWSCAYIVGDVPFYLK